MDNLIHPLITVFIAIIAVFIAFLNFRYQIIILINTVLTSKAARCNFHLEEAERFGKNLLNDKQIILSLLTEIITTEKLLDYYLKKHRFATFLKNKMYFIDPFYLQLNITIKILFNKNIDNVAEGLNYHFKDEGINKNYITAVEFLKESVGKYG